MMKALFLALVLAASAATGYAQTSASVSTATTIPGATTEPQKGTNTILIQTTDSVTVALKKIARSMVLKGYSVKTLDQDLGYVVTEPRNVGGGITTNSTAFVFKAVAESSGAGTLLSWWATRKSSTGVAIDLRNQCSGPSPT